MQQNPWYKNPCLPTKQAMPESVESFRNSKAQFLEQSMLEVPPPALEPLPAKLAALKIPEQISFCLVISDTLPQTAQIVPQNHHFLSNVWH